MGKTREEADKSDLFHQKVKTEIQYKILPEKNARNYFNGRFIKILSYLKTG